MREGSTDVKRTVEEKGGQMFYIRADGNEKVGMGHVMRCLAIAEALRRLGAEVLFVTADEKPAGLIEGKGFDLKVLSVRYDDMEGELPRLREIMEEDTGRGRSGRSALSADFAENEETEKPKILVDSYFITPGYLDKLRDLAKVILLDDEKRMIYPCDGLVNYNIYGKTLGYERDYPALTWLFLGCEYMPLRGEFRDCGYEVRDKAEHILFTTGGGDACHIALAIAGRLIKKSGEENGAKSEAENGIKSGIECGIEKENPPVWHIVCGPYHPDTEKLEKFATDHKFLRIHKNMTSMSELMRKCDIAVSAAGSTFYELSSIGIPTIGFYFVENQRQNMETFAKLTPIKNAGDFSKKPESVLDFIEEEVKTLCREKALREEISQSMKTIVDGGGADRLAKAFLSL